MLEHQCEGKFIWNIFSSFSPCLALFLLLGSFHFHARFMPFRQPGDEESIRKILKDGRLRMALIEEFTKQSVPWFVNFTMLLGGFT